MKKQKQIKTVAQIMNEERKKTLHKLSRFENLSSEFNKWLDQCERIKELQQFSDIFPQDIFMQVLEKEWLKCSELMNDSVNEENDDINDGQKYELFTWEVINYLFDQEVFHFKNRKNFSRLLFAEKRREEFNNFIEEHEGDEAILEDYNDIIWEWIRKNWNENINWPEMPYPKI